MKRRLDLPVKKLSQSHPARSRPGQSVNTSAAFCAYVSRAASKIFPSAEAEDFTVCPIPGQMLGKKWSEMDTDVVTWAYLKTMEKYPQYIKQGHIDAMKAVLEDRGALPEA